MFMEYSLTCFVLLGLFVPCYNGLKVWDMRSHCGEDIRPTTYAGEIELKSTTNNPTTCTIHVSPPTFKTHGGSEKNLMLIYFTEFDLQSTVSCDSEYVQMVDGLNQLVNGLEAKFCGRNSTLVEYERYFLVPRGQLTITYFSGANVYQTGRFVLRFVAVQRDGDCTGSGVHQCSNAYCVPYEYACNDEILSCGEYDYNCEHDVYISDEETVGFQFSDIFKYLGIVIFIVVGLAIIKSFFKSCKNRDVNTDCCRCIRDCVCGCVTSVHRKLRRCRETASTRVPERIRHIRNHFTGTNSQTRETSTHDATQNTVSEDDYRTEHPVFQHGQDGEDHDERFTRSPPVLPEYTAGLPPSYSEAMASNNTQIMFTNSSSERRLSNSPREAISLDLTVTVRNPDVSVTQREISSSEAEIINSNTGISNNRNDISIPDEVYYSDDFEDDDETVYSVSTSSIDSLDVEILWAPVELSNAQPQSLESLPPSPLPNQGTPPPEPEVLPPPPSPPPPSYEEAIGEPGVEDIPGYDECMANQTKYGLNR